MEIKIELDITKILNLTEQEIFTIEEAKEYLMQFKKIELINSLFEYDNEEIKDVEYINEEEKGESDMFEDSTDEDEEETKEIKTKKTIQPKKEEVDEFDLLDDEEDNTDDEL